MTLGHITYFVIDFYVILVEFRWLCMSFWATEGVFHMYKQRRHRTTISGHHTTILDVLESFWYWKNRTTMLSIVLRCKKSMSHYITTLSIVLRCKKSLSHRTTTLSIVLRCKKSQHYLRKSPAAHQREVAKFWGKKQTFGARTMDRRLETIKTHIR
jgi:hypothetical protein